MQMYSQLKELQKLAWKSDDRMDQETLFELQDKLAELTLQAAIKEGKTADLQKAFPFLYERG
jgi:CxxC motif-containing protein